MNSQRLPQAELSAVHPSCTVKEMEFGKWNRKQESVVDKDSEIKTSSNLFFFVFSILEKEEIKSELAN